MNIKAYIYTFIILLAISISCWYALESAKKSLKQHQPVNDTNPDFFMKDMNYLQFDDAGVLQNQITTPYFTHYASDDHYIFVKPQMKMLDKNKQIWDINANNGKSTRGSDAIYLWDNVNINQFDTVNKLQKLTIATSAATIYPHKKQAETDQPVVINQIDSIIHATGAKVDFNASQVKLLSKVKGQYDSAAKNK